MKEYQFAGPKTVDLLNDGEFKAVGVTVEEGHMYLRGEHVPVEGKGYPATLHVILSEDVRGDTAEEILAAAAPYWESWEIDPEPQYELWQHAKSGKLYAVKLLAGVVVAAVGPLYYAEADEVPLDGWDYGEPDAADDGAWVEVHRDEFVKVR